MAHEISNLGSSPDNEINRL